MVKGLLPGRLKVAKPQLARPTAGGSEPRSPVLERSLPKSGGTRASAGSAPPPKGAAPLPRSPGSRIDRAIAFLNQRARAISAEIITIGKYLLREFFDDDPRAVASKDPAKMNSLRDLAARADCPFSRATLWRAVNLALQERRLGTVSSMRQLTPTHKIALLSVQDLEEKRELAEEAVEQGWSTRELRTQVRQRSKPRQQKGPKGETRGGGEIALAEGSLKHVAKAARAGALSPGRLADLPAARLARLASLMDEVAALLSRSSAAARRSLPDDPE